MDEQKLTTGKVARWWGRQMVGPYLRMGQETTRLVNTVGHALPSIREMWRARRIRLQARRARGRELEQGTLDGHARFEAIAAEQQMTPEMFATRRGQFLKTKWVCFWLMFVCLFCGVACALFIPGLNGVLYVIGLLLSTAYFGVQVFRFTLYAVQIEERTLFTAKQFLGRENFFRLLLK